MRTYSIMLVLFTFVLAVSNQAEAAVFTNYGYPNNSWWNSANWDGGFPGINSEVTMTINNTICEIATGDSPIQCQGVYIGCYGADNDMYMSGGSLNCQWFDVGRGADPNTNGYFKMTGGNVTTTVFSVPEAFGTNVNYMPIGKAEIFGGTVHVTTAGFQLGDRVYMKYGGGYGTLEMRTGGTIVIDANMLDQVRNDLYNGYITASTVTPNASALMVVSATSTNTTLTVQDTLASQARNPSPNGWAKKVYTLTSASQTTALSWTSGANKFRENLYFSQNPDLVVNRNPSARYPNASTTVSSPVSVGSLDLGKTYYWQIETKNTSLQLIPGQLWSFRIADYILADNFDDYTGIWTNNGGATSSVVDNMGLKLAPYGKSLKIQVGAGQSGSVSCVPAGSNWTVKNVKGLYIDLYGRTTNSANAVMTVTLNDSASVTYTGALNVEGPGGNRVTWKIPLNNFGLNMGSITKLTVGINNSTGTGDCVVNIDEIRLVPEQCLARPTADFNGDCLVNLSDLLIMSDNWLVSGLGLPQ